MCVPRVGGYFREDRARTTMRISGPRLVVTPLSRLRGGPRSDHNAGPPKDGPYDPGGARKAPTTLLPSAFNILNVLTAFFVSRASTPRNRSSKHRINPGSTCRIPSPQPITKISGTGFTISTNTSDSIVISEKILGFHRNHRSPTAITLPCTLLSPMRNPPGRQAWIWTRRPPGWIRLNLSVLDSFAGVGGGPSPRSSSSPEDGGCPLLNPLDASHPQGWGDDLQGSVRANEDVDADRVATCPSLPISSP
jgi:hypothetical protein